MAPEDDGIRRGGSLKGTFHYRRRNCLAGGAPGGPVLLQQKSGNALRVYDSRGEHVVPDDQEYRAAPAALYGP